MSRQRSPRRVALAMAGIFAAGLIAGGAATGVAILGHRSTVAEQVHWQP